MNKRTPADTKGTNGLATITPLEPNTTMARAYLLMEKHRSPNLPVSSEDQVVGVICERDIQALIKTYGISPQPHDLKVANFMRGPVKSVDVDTNLASIARLMLDERVSAVLVLCGKDVLGALTKDDLLEILAEIVKDQPTNLLDSLRTVNEAFSQRSCNKGH